MATKISFFNLKGGVGKTSLLVNVASCLAYLGKKVLVVDFDAQSNSSIWLMRLDRWNALNRNPSNFILSLFKETGSSISSCIQKDVVRDSDGEIALKGLDLWFTEPADRHARLSPGCIYPEALFNRNGHQPDSDWTGYHGSGHIRCSHGSVDGTFQ